MSAAAEKLSFDEARHEYRWDGVPLVSVTQVLRCLGLTMNGSEAARQRGTEVHTLTAAWDREEEPDPVLMNRHLGYLVSWMRFRELCGFEPLLIEQRLAAHQAGLAGTLDRLGWMEDTLVMLDIKSGQVTPTTGLQLAGYRQLLQVNQELLPLAARTEPECLAVHLQADGRPARLEWYGSPEDAAAWEHALQLYRWTRLRRACRV